MSLLKSTENLFTIFNGCPTMRPGRLPCICVPAPASRSARIVNDTLDEIPYVRLKLSATLNCTISLDLRNTRQMSILHKPKTMWLLTILNPGFLSTSVRPVWNTNAYSTINRFPLVQNLTGSTYDFGRWRVNCLNQDTQD